MDTLEALLAHQDGVVRRSQLLELGFTRPQIETKLRRRELAPVHPGVYVDHTGTPTYRQRCWAAVLYAAPAALTLKHALPDPPTRGAIDVAIDWTRQVRTRPGIRVHRVRDLTPKVQWNRSPPKLKVVQATLALARTATTDLDAIAAFTDAVGSRRTTSARLAAGLSSAPRMRRRTLLTALLTDLESGTHSVLEHGFLTQVLRPHRLPEPSGQQAPLEGARGREYRDVAFDELEAHVELDGRTHDAKEQRDLDAERDLADLAQGVVTPRLRWPQVFGDPCRTAQLLAAFFATRGWNGAAHPCSSSCPVAAQDNGES